MREITNVLERIAEQLEVMNSNNEKCNHCLEELRYYYENDWGITAGSIAWDKQGKAKTFHYCKKCGQVFVKDREQNII